MAHKEERHELGFLFNGQCSELGLIHAHSFSIRRCLKICPCFVLDHTHDHALDPRRGLGFLTMTYPHICLAAVTWIMERVANLCILGCGKLAGVFKPVKYSTSS